MKRPGITAAFRLPRAPLAAALLLAACAGAPPASAPGAAPSASASAADARTVLAGVFTAPQAARGQAQFTRTCASCHSASEFSGPVFQRIWAGRAVGELYHVMSTLMPQNDPGGLSAQQYADILAFFLQQNGYPQGERELPADAAALDQVSFQPAP